MNNPYTEAHEIWKQFKKENGLGETKIREMPGDFDKPVKGSGGNEYTVRRVTGVYTCTCPSFTFCKGPDKFCKHTEAEKEKEK